MAYILHIESTSTVCSVAISNNDELIAIKELNNGYTHAENLHLFIESVLLDAKLTAKDLNAISISSGPGSYTGLRIGFSAAKGLAYALQIPLITIDTLKALSFDIINSTKSNALYCPLIDARRMEVYCALFDKDLNTILEVQPLVLTEESVTVFNRQTEIYFFGDGMQKAIELLKLIPNSNFIENCLPSAKSMIALAYQKFKTQDFANVAYVEPNYLKDFFFTTSKK